MDPRFARFEDVKTFALADGVTNVTADVVERQAANRALTALSGIDEAGVIHHHTLAEVAARAAQWAHVLRAHPLAPGDRVVIAVGQSPTWQAVMLGAIKAGVVPVPCPAGLESRQLAARIGAAKARLVVAERADERRVDVLRGSLDLAADVLYLDDAQLLLSRCSRTAPTEGTRWFEDGLVLFTSGMGDAPRAVTHTHAYAAAAAEQAQGWLGAGPGDVVWSTAPPGSVAALWCTLGAWSCGAGLAVIEGEHSPAEQLVLAARLGVTVLALRRDEYLALAAVPADEPVARFVPRHAVSTGERLDVSLIEEVEERFGVTIHDGYGQTETTLLLANPHGTPTRAGSVGVPTAGQEVVILNAEGYPAAPYEVGEIAVRGHPPSLFSDYAGDAERTAAAFRAQHYLTGDRAWQDDDGYVWLAEEPESAAGPAGSRVDPARLELALLRHPAVAQAAVVAAPADPGEPAYDAFVVVRDGVGAPSPTELERAARDAAEDASIALAVQLVASLPRTWTGKVRRAALRARSTTPSRASSLVAPTPHHPGDDGLLEHRRRLAHAARETQAGAAAGRAAEVERREPSSPDRGEAPEQPSQDWLVLPVPLSPGTDVDLPTGARGEDDQYRLLERYERERRADLRALEEDVRVSASRSWHDRDEDSPRAGGTLAERLSRYGRPLAAPGGADAAA
jgi:acyl-coenzyme A synthetase/AMP-(fatty) acid ligase